MAEVIAWEDAAEVINTAMKDTGRRQEVRSLPWHRLIVLGVMALATVGSLFTMAAGGSAEGFVGEGNVDATRHTTVVPWCANVGHSGAPAGFRETLKPRPSSQRTSQRTRRR